MLKHNLRKCRSNVAGRAVQCRHAGHFPPVRQQRQLHLRRDGRREAAAGRRASAAFRSNGGWPSTAATWRSVDAVVISHDHVDHCRSMGILHRKFGLPIHVTAKTHRAAARYGLGKIADVRHFRSGQTLRFGKVAVETIPTPHDGVDGVAFVVDDGRRRLGILTDLGHVFAGLADVLRSLDAVLLESNYDPEMLADGPYPDWLKERIRGPAGHISNVEAAELLRAGRFEALAVGLPGASLRGQQHAGGGAGDASADRGPAAAAAGRHSARSHRRAGGVTRIGRAGRRKTTSRNERDPRTPGHHVSGRPRKERGKVARYRVKTAVDFQSLV